jgi:hypothetical protein
MGLAPKPLTAEAARTHVSFRFLCNLAAGDYAVSLGVANGGFNRQSFREYLLVRHEALILKVLANDDAIIFAGVTNLAPLCAVDHAPLG